MQIILDKSQITEVLEELAGRIAADVDKPHGTGAGAGAALALVGIRSRGEILAQRLQKLLQERLLGDIDRGTLDITLYRDDLDRMGYQQPKVRSTEIDFNIDDRQIVLVDDVLNTGRSVRAALDALIDLGRPRVIRLAVLIDRGHRELPIGADYVGRTIDAPVDKRVLVCLDEVDDRDEVVLEQV